MNGLGIAGTYDNVPHFLLKLKTLLKKEGKILIDSTDIAYLFEENDGSVWVNLNNKYKGEMKFKLVYKTTESKWFPWLYLDFGSLKEIAKKVGLSCKLIKEDDNNSYLAELTIK